MLLPEPDPAPGRADRPPPGAWEGNKLEGLLADSRTRAVEKRAQKTLDLPDTFVTVFILLTDY